MVENMDERRFKEKLNPEQYRIMRERGTEMPYSGKYWDHEGSGVYFCAACGNKLFSSLAKFDAKDGWPAFRNPTSKKDIELKPDGRGGTEVSCRKCASHLGEVVGEGDGQYYRINSACLDFQEVGIEFEEKEEEGEDSTKPKEDEEKSIKKDAGVNVPTVKTIALVVGGVVVGVGIGFVLCYGTETDLKSEGMAPLSTTVVQPMNAVGGEPTIMSAPSPGTQTTLETPSAGAATSPKSSGVAPEVIPSTTTTLPPEENVATAPSGSTVTSDTASSSAATGTMQDGGGVPIDGGTVSGGR